MMVIDGLGTIYPIEIHLYHVATAYLDDLAGSCLYLALAAIRFHTRSLSRPQLAEKILLLGDPNGPRHKHSGVVR